MQISGASSLFRHHHEDIADFHSAANASEDRRKGLRIPQRTGVPKCLDYFSISKFSPQVERYLKVFGGEAVKVVLLEDLAAAPEQTYRDIPSFLGVDESFQPEFLVHNERPRSGSLERSITFLYKRLGMKHMAHLILPRAERRKFLSAIRHIERDDPAPDERDSQLLETCRPDVDRLSKLIGRDLSHWRRDTRR